MSVYELFTSLCEAQEETGRKMTLIMLLFMLTGGKLKFCFLHCIRSVFV